MVTQEQREPESEFSEAALLFTLHLEATKSKGIREGIEIKYQQKPLLLRVGFIGKEGWVLGFFLVYLILFLNIVIHFGSKVLCSVGFLVPTKTCSV